MRGQGAWWMAGAIAAALWVTGARAETGATDRSTGTSASDSAEQAGEAASDSARSAGEEAKGAANRAASSARSTASEASTGAQGAAKGQKLSASWRRTLEKMHVGNQFEIEAGTYMRDHAASDETKQFASRMVSEHGAMDADLTSYAQGQGVDLTAARPGKNPMESQLAHIRKLSGVAADRAYAKLMVQEHQKDVKEAKSAAQKAKGEQKPELASLLDDAAKMMQDHLSDARKLEKDLTQRQAKGRGSGSTGTGASSQGSQGNE